MAMVRGLSQTFKIALFDGTELPPITTGMPEIIRWERANKRSYIDGTPTLEQMLWTAYAAGRRQKIIGDEFPTFDSWFPLVLDYEVVDDDADPTRTEPGTEPSSD